jgi:drug/metabolite transporter (DMT)-like permease
MIELGILLALASALAVNVSMLCRHRGAVAAPDVRFTHPLRSAAALFRSRWWTIGFAIAAGGFALHVVALSFAPLSLVETVISGCIVLLAYLAQRWFGLRVTPREWLGLALIAAGLAFLGATVPDTAHHGGEYSHAAMIAFESGAVGMGALLLLSGTAGSRGSGRGPLLGLAAGLLLGVSNISIKALTSTVPADPLSIVSPWTLALVLAGVGAFFALARGFQTGGAISVTALASVAANCVSIGGGVLVFGDPIGADPLEVVLRSVAFAVVVTATALMPARLGEPAPGTRAAPASAQGA